MSLKTVRDEDGEWEPAKILHAITIYSMIVIGTLVHVRIVLSLVVSLIR